MELAIRAALGALIVILISLFSRTPNFFIAGLLPLFPTFALIAHFIVGAERTVADLKSTIIFGMLSLIPYFVYLLTVYFMIDRYKLIPSLIGGVVTWTIVATILIILWKQYA